MYSFTTYGMCMLLTHTMLHTVRPVLIASFSRVRKLFIRKNILLIAHPYVQFVQTQKFKFAM